MVKNVYFSILLIIIWWFLTAAGGLLWIFDLHLLLKKREEKRTQENIWNSTEHITREIQWFSILENIREEKYGQCHYCHTWHFFNDPLNFEITYYFVSKQDIIGRST